MAGAQARGVTRDQPAPGGVVREMAVRDETRCWEDLMVAVRREAEMAGGYGGLVVSIEFHQGRPQELRVLERKPQYRLGGGTAAPPGGA